MHGGKISLFAPHVFRHFDRDLEGLATKFDVIAPTDFPACCFCSVTCLVILELHKYSNNLSITVSAASTEDAARGVSFHGFPVSNHSLCKE